MKSTDVGAYRGVCSKQTEGLVYFFKIWDPSPTEEVLPSSLSTPVHRNNSQSAQNSIIVGRFKPRETYITS